MRNSITWREYKWLGRGVGGSLVRATTRNLAYMKTKIESQIEEQVLRGDCIVKCDATGDRYEIEVKVTLRRQR